MSRYLRERRKIRTDQIRMNLSHTRVLMSKKMKDEDEDEDGEIQR